ncbi:suppressor of fused domain protein [Flammeovirga sp. MY04]|uniref:suppressor of fused domain protein n=1 Tax=Flammeovirga sp. MY04 TaxID=1191459 RepID=UPI0008061CDA|nr:suppressor of fused domain protein [Flammeovirga sp. MY04]ANQ49887.1 suppressor of fused domain protein [Flammeovirga sp. MY04]
MNFLKKLITSYKDKFQKPEILLEEESPTCPITAIVEQDHRVVYFYLYASQNSNFGMKSCWVRNLVEAPDESEIETMLNGKAPLLPKQFCKFPNGQKPLDAYDLEIIWTEEGDAAALKYQGEIVAIIPSWSGEGDFHGYARDVIGQSNLAWEIGTSNVFLERIEKAKEFWQSWGDDLNPFQIHQPQILKIYEETFGKQDTYYAIDGGKWPPKGMYLRKGTSKNVFATVGVSLVPMPSVEMYFEKSHEVDRIELGLILNSTISESDVQETANYISGQSSLPWNNITFLGEGHTINFKPIQNSIFNAVILTNKLDVLPKPELEDYRSSKVNFLWMIPISEKERIFVMENEKSDIIHRLNKIGNEVFSLDREEVV